MTNEQMKQEIRAKLLGALLVGPVSELDKNMGKAIDEYLNALDKTTGRAGAGNTTKAGPEGKRITLELMDEHNYFEVEVEIEDTSFDHEFGKEKTTGLSLKKVTLLAEWIQGERLDVTSRITDNLRNELILKCQYRLDNTEPT